MSRRGCNPCERCGRMTHPGTLCAHCRVLSMPTKVCLQCKTRIRPASAATPYSHALVRFCSTKCGARYRADHAPDIAHRKKCAHCGKTFAKRPSLCWDSWERQLFCDIECRGLAQHAPFAKQINPCRGCGEIMMRQPGESSARFFGRRFHSVTCASLARRKRDTKPCAQCGDTMERTPGYSDKTWRKKEFCSHKCVAKFYRIVQRLRRKPRRRANAQSCGAQ
jgi:hypothetical protein